MKLTACITCYKNDIHHLDECLGYIRGQTVLPDEILVVANAIADDSYLRKKAETEGFSLYTDVDQHLPGWGRNMGLQLAQNEVVAFCDVDDQWMPSKVEFIKNVWNDDMDALVHNYYYKEFTTAENLDSYVEEITEVEPNNNNVRTKNVQPVHHGHMTCKKSVGIMHKYREDMVRGEDGNFCQRLVKDENIKIFYSPLKLMVYKA